MTRIAALTHVRKDDFFLAMWIEHYAAICGRANLHVMLDGNDWTPDVDLSGVNVQVLSGRSGMRVRDDERLSKAHLVKLEELFGRYDYVIRGDCDEFVCIDPASGLDWAEALKEVDAEGYIYCNGVDVIHDPRVECAYDPARPVLSQRSFGVVQKHYFKPNIMSRAIPTSAGGHRADGPVVVSRHFMMFHLANMDEGIFVERIRTRVEDASKGSYDIHAQGRRDVSSVVETCTDPLPFDEGLMRGRIQISTRGRKPIVFRPQKFREGNVEIFGLKAFLVRLDPRLSALI